MSDTFTRYGSNITNVAGNSPAKLCTKKYENPSIFVKVKAKKISGTFLCGHGVVYDQ